MKLARPQLRRRHRRENPDSLDDIHSQGNGDFGAEVAGLIDFGRQRSGFVLTQLESAQFPKQMNLSFVCMGLRPVQYSLLCCDTD